MLDDLKGTVSIVTGAAGGIGRAIAVRLSKNGSKVLAADISEDGLKETLALIEKEGGEGAYIVADVSSQDDINKIVEKAAGDFGGLDILVNNAGVSTFGFIESVADAEIERIFSVNLNAVIKLTRACVPHLKKSGRGRIINVSSVEGIRGSGLLPVYSASKAGVIGLTRSNAIELARHMITVNAVCPGPIRTNMLAGLIADKKFEEKVKKGVPMKRLGTPEDIAGPVAFCASEDASYVTGNIIVIDGGMTVKAL
jgi:3-oxoacyl-[acyl-carrier protein] reductase